MRVLPCGIRPPAATSLLALLGGRAPNDSRMFPWRILFHSSCPHFFGRRPLDAAQKGQRLLAFLRGCELSADYSARSFRRRSSSSASWWRLTLLRFRHGNSIDELDVLGTQALGYADGIKVLCDGIERGRNIAGLYDEGADALAQTIIG